MTGRLSLMETYASDAKKFSHFRKRKGNSRGEEDSDDDSNLSAPSNDVYRSRQKKKIK